MKKPAGYEERERQELNWHCLIFGNSNIARVLHPPERRRDERPLARILKIFSWIVRFDMDIKLGAIDPPRRKSRPRTSRVIASFGVLPLIYFVVGVCLSIGGCCFFII